MKTYTCSICEQKISGDLVVFTDHTEEHVIALIKEDNPDWVQEDGLCQRCRDYFRSEIKGSFFKTASCAKRSRMVRRALAKIKAFFKR